MKGSNRRAVINNWASWWGHREKCSVCRTNLSFCICNAWFNFAARAQKRGCMSFYFGGFGFTLILGEKNRLSETAFLLPSKPNTILPSSSNHVSGLQANPKKLKIALNQPQLLVAAREDKDHKQKAVLPTCYSRGVCSSQWKCRKMEMWNNRPKESSFCIWQYPSILPQSFN